MTNFFRCLKKISDQESVEKVVIDDHYETIKYNLGITLKYNQDNKHNTFEKLKQVLTNGKLTNFSNDWNTYQHCRLKDSHCYPVYQPSEYLKESVKEYEMKNMRYAGYELSGVNLCAHEKGDKPHETHVEFYFRNPKNLSHRIVINTHLTFEKGVVNSNLKFHDQLKGLLAASSSTAVIANILGKSYQKALKTLSDEHSVLAQINPSNCRHHGFFVPRASGHQSILTKNHQHNSLVKPNKSLLLQNRVR